MIDLKVVKSQLKVISGLLYLSLLIQSVNHSFLCCCYPKTLVVLISDYKKRCFFCESYHKIAQEIQANFFICCYYFFGFEPLISTLWQPLPNKVILSKTEKILGALLVRLKRLRKQLLEQIFQILDALGFHFIYSVLNNFG